MINESLHEQIGKTNERINKKLVLKIDCPHIYNIEIYFIWRLVKCGIQ